jgi:hypothetical protein
VAERVRAIRHLAASLVAVLFLGLAAAGAQPAAELPSAMPGWSITRSHHDFEQLAFRTQKAVAAAPLTVLLKWSPTQDTEGKQVRLRKSLVLGVYSAAYALRTAEASTAAMLETPLRVLVSENDDGSATLAYKLPSVVFAPYTDGGPGLVSLAKELDGILAHIAREATAGR